MNFKKRFFSLFIVSLVIFSGSVSTAGGQDYAGEEDPNKKILKQGLLGAGVGAISAEASGGKAGTGALVGAGTNVIGGALLDTLTGPSQPAPRQMQQQVQYVQAVPAQTQYAQQSYPQQSYQQQSYPVQPQGGYVEAQPVYVQQAPAYYPPREDPNKKIIKQGLLGAGVGAISASASGGKAGKGALIGAGTNVIGGALLDSLMGGGSSQPQQQAQPVYVQQVPQYANQGYGSQGYTQASAPSQPKKKIIRRYDSDGNIVAEEEVWE